jgi:ABC-type transporter Mla subunit MlaD
LNQKNEVVDSLINELNNFKSDSEKSSDQIDDTISNLQLIRKYLSDTTDKLDNVVNNMDDYSKNGRKYLY